MGKTFESFQSVEAIERAERQKAEHELRHALNNHADNLVSLNQHYEQMHAAVTKLQDQMDVLLDSVAQMTRRLDALEQAAQARFEHEDAV